MIAHDIKSATEEHLQADGSLDLSTLAASIKPIKNLLDCLPIEGLVVLQKTQIIPPSKRGRFALQGQLSGIGALRFLLTIEAGQRKHEDLLVIRAELSGTKKLPLPKIRGFRIEDSFFALEIHGERMPEGAFGFTVHAGDFTMPLSMPLPPPDVEWEWAGAFDPIPIPALSELAALTGRKDIEQILPPGGPLDMQGLVLRDFAVAVNPRQLQLTRLRLSLQLEKWDIAAGKLMLQAIDLVFDLRYPTVATQRSLTGHLNGELLIGTKVIPLSGLMNSGFHIEGFADELKLKTIAQQYVPQITEKLPQLTLRNVSIALATPGEIAFSASISANLSKLAKDCSLPIPQALHAIEIPRIAFKVDAANATAAMNLSMDSPKSLIASKWGQLSLIYCHIALNKNSKSSLSTDCEFKLEGGMDLGPAGSIEIKDLIFSKQSALRKWKASGSVDLTLFGQTYPLEVEIARIGNAHQLIFTYRKIIKLDAFNGLGTLSLKNISLTLNRESSSQPEKNTTAPSVSLGVSGEVTLNVKDLFKTEGILRLEASPEGPRLIILAEPPELEPIPLPVESRPQPQAVITLDRMRIKMSEAAAPTRGLSAQLEAGAHVAFTAIPATLEKFLPAAPIKGQFLIDQKGARLALAIPDTMQPDIPELGFSFSNGYKLSLGKPEVRIESMDILLWKKPSIRQRIHLSIPKALNKIFGVDANGSPQKEVFEDACRLELTLAKAITCTLMNSPIKGLEFYQKYEKNWIDGDFGDCGVISFQVPEFALSAGRWQASFGFERLTELKIPLKPVKFLLEKMGLPKATLKALPDIMPLESINLSSPDAYAEFPRLLGEDFFNKLPKAVKTALKKFSEALATGMERAPKRLLEYFESSTPRSGLVEIEMAANGVKCGLKVPKGGPLKLLWPTLLPLPGLNGITVQGFSLAPRSGGALLEVGFDGYIDRFDLVSLGAGLALDQAKDLSKRFILSEFVAYMPTSMPLPIPIFYKELGLEYRDILGLELQSHWKFPEPILSVIDQIEMLGGLGRFLTVREALLHEAGLPDSLQLDFTVGKNQIRLPDYLGGKTLGLKEALPPLDVDRSIALFLDSVKTANPRYLIEAIPLKVGEGTHTQWIRVGQTRLKLGPFGISAGWCITTEKEFIKEVLPALKAGTLTQLPADRSILSVLPGKRGTPALDRGFIILLAGQFQIGKILKLESQFGLILSASSGFSAGVQMGGTLANFLRLEVGGILQATPQKLHIQGGITLKGGRRTWLNAQGEILVSDRQLSIKTTLKISNSFQIAGLFVIGSRQLSLGGRLSWKISQKKTIAVAVQVTFDSRGISFRFAMKLFSFKFDVGVQVGPKGLVAYAALRVPKSLQGSLNRAMKSLAREYSATNVGKSYARMMSDFKALGDVELSINGMREDLPGLCKSIVRMITSTINSEVNKHLDKAWEKPFRKTAKKIAHGYAKPYVRRLNRIATVAARPNGPRYKRDLKDALNQLVKHNRLVIRVGIPQTKISFVAYRRNIMNAKQLKMLKQGIASIDGLPETSKRIVSNKSIFGRFPKKEQIMAQVCYEIEHEMGDVFPSIESIGFATRLGSLNTNSVALQIAVTHRGKRKTYKITADLSSPGAMAKSIGKAVIKG